MHTIGESYLGSKPWRIVCLFFNTPLTSCQIGTGAYLKHFLRRTFGAVQPAPRRSRLIRCALLLSDSSHLASRLLPSLRSPRVRPLMVNCVSTGLRRSTPILGVSERGFNPECQQGNHCLGGWPHPFSARRNFNYHKLGAAVTDSAPVRQRSVGATAPNVGLRSRYSLFLKSFRPNRDFDRDFSIFGVSTELLHERLHSHLCRASFISSHNLELTRPPKKFFAGTRNPTPSNASPLLGSLLKSCSERPEFVTAIVAHCAFAWDPFKIRWSFEHRDYIEGRQFRDVQISGPFRRWEHTHKMDPQGPSACILTDSYLLRTALGMAGKFAGWLVGPTQTCSPFRISPPP